MLLPWKTTKTRMNEAEALVVAYGLTRYVRQREGEDPFSARETVTAALRVVFEHADVDFAQPFLENPSGPKGMVLRMEGKALGAGRVDVPLGPGEVTVDTLERDLGAALAGKVPSFDPLKDDPFSFSPETARALQKMRVGRT